MTRSPTPYGVLTLSIASIIMLWYQVGLSAALQQSPINSLSSRRHVLFHPSTTCQWSASVDEVTMEETAVASYDWDEQLEELLAFKAKYGHCNFPQNPHAEVNKEYPTLARFCQDQRLDYDRTRKTLLYSDRMSLPTFDRSVRFGRLKEMGFEFGFLAVNFYDKYLELLEFRNRNGHVRVSKKEHRLLYAWICNNRKRRNGTKGYSRLPENHIQLLDDIGFEWESEIYDIRWMEKYKELVDFRSKHGHLDIDTSGPLFVWMDKQRSRFSRKKHFAPLSDQQIRLLDDIEFPWVTYRNEAKWYTRYEELESFQKDNGYSKLKSLQPNLYSWLHSQRKKREKGLLSNKQIELLNKIEFPWEVNSPKWPEMYRKLNAYHHEHGHLRVTRDDDPSLYDWLAILRQRYHGTIQPPLKDLQILKIEQMPFCWSEDWRERTWREKYTEIVEFYKQHGHVRATKKINSSLFNWIQTQKMRYTELKGQKPLSEEELELLEQLDFPFFENQTRMAWNTMYAEVVKYQKTHKGRLPVSHKDDPELNRWMRQQQNRMRCAYGYVPLSDEQKAMLESIDFPFLPQGNQMRNWYSKYDQLVDFWKEHDNFLVENDKDPSLHSWIDKQRCRYKGVHLSASPMSKSEIYLLDRIGFPWTSNRPEVGWQERYQELVQFKEDHGHIRVSGTDHPSLANWVFLQRQRWRGGAPSEMLQHQVKQLEKIGFMF